MNLRSTEEKESATLTQQEKREIWIAWHKAGSWDNFLHSVKAQKKVGYQETVVQYPNSMMDEYETKFVEKISGIDNFFEDKTVVFTQDHKTAPRINTGYFLPRNYWDWCLKEMMNDRSFKHPFAGKDEDNYTIHQEALRISARVKLMEEGKKMHEQTNDDINDRLVQMTKQANALKAEEEKKMMRAA